MPSFRETDPSKIAAGFGGTLNLVTGLGYLILVIVLMAGPWHTVAAMQDDPVSGAFGLLLTAGCAVLGLLVGAVAVFLPLHYGARNLRQMEF